MRGSKGPCRRGYLLSEALLVLLLLAPAFGFGLSALWDWQEEQQLTQAAREVASAIRQTQAAAKDGSPGAGAIYFKCTSDFDGTVFYQARQGGSYVPPKGTLPANITCPDGVDIAFVKSGFAGSDATKNSYRLHLVTKDKKYVRTLIVEMYTGRVRITDTW